MNNLEQFYAAVGGDASAVVSRVCGNSALVTRLLGKFLNDGSFKSLTDALSAGKTEEAFRAAHTLKGVAANLGLGNLANKASEVTEYLRSGDIASAITALPALKEEYDKVCALISKPE